MASALTLIERTGGSKISFLLILSGEAESLLDLVEAERPALRVMVDSARAALPLPTAPSQKERRIDLTAAERELARMLLSDLSLTQISQRRGVSVNTVKSQVRSIYGKLGVSSRADALLALRSPSS
jgi:DNA-binding CsgD family transcriptional regulator